MSEYKNTSNTVVETMESRRASSRCCVRLRRSEWRVHQFEVLSGELVCRAAALRMNGALLLWLGGGGAPALGEVAAGSPGLGKAAPGASGGLATTLLAGGGGGSGAAAALARRLAASLAQPVFVCCGADFDRLALPLVERGLVAEIKSRPECF